MFSKRLREIRKQKGFTQKELSEKSGLAIVNISFYERERITPNLFSLECLCGALEVTATELLGF